VRSREPVADQIADLIAYVESLSLNQGIEKSLTGKLRNALAALNGSRAQTTCAMLGSFGQETRAQSGKAISTADADSLLTRIDRINAALSCGS